MTGWIEDWFGSEYYSLLYKHRDCNEAKLFLDNLISLLQLPAKSSILDCGCGKGRHSVYLAEKGFEVTGVDISEKSIQEASQQKRNNLAFFTHDMRNYLRINYYDIALSLFTSFGYFENDHENEKMIRSMAAAVKHNGWVVLDFMNAKKEISELVPHEKFSEGKVDFEIKRLCKANSIVKEIFITVKSEKHFYKELVRTYGLSDLSGFFAKNKLQIVHTFGDYHLNRFNEIKSERLILIGKKS
ncbi:MAG TPA: class I SAM-dependent methyltransferase [Bacteroidia bacterium]